ncbi:MAG: GH92 family glycosyl hydrolase, partial [Bacteroidota bacterium]|nr:GH92 family glycosyl hydrolase [Bacteroidota bacterium]
MCTLRNLTIVLFLICCNRGISQNRTLTDFVDPFIGTATVGHTYPAATLPFGMVQVGPDTGVTGWERCSGYNFKDSSIMGFSHTHMSGTGAADMGDILIMPLISGPQFEPGTDDDPKQGYRSRFSHASEVAKPGYYAVKLEDSNIYAEMTATYRAGFHCYTFPESKQAGIVIDLNHGIQDGVIESSFKVIDTQTIIGHRQSNGFINNHQYYFCARFSKPFEKFTSFVDGQIAEEKDVKGKACKVFVHFITSNNEKILVKVGLSTVSEEEAMKNLDSEIPSWDFKKTVRNAQAIWNENLSKIEVQTNTESEKKIFYTALYHCLITPNLITDIDGSYRGWDQQIHQSSTGDFYTNFSLWDTFRASHPLYALIYPEKNIRFINSMLERYKQIGQLPINEYGANETYCMIGYHSIPV